MSTTWPMNRDQLTRELAKSRARVAALTRLIARYGIDVRYARDLADDDELRVEFEAELLRIGPDPKAAAHRRALLHATRDAS